MPAPPAQIEGSMAGSSGAEGVVAGEGLEGRGHLHLALGAALQLSVRPADLAEPAHRALVAVGAIAHHGPPVDLGLAGAGRVDDERVEAESVAPPARVAHVESERLAPLGAEQPVRATGDAQHAEE